MTSSPQRSSSAPSKLLYATGGNILRLSTHLDNNKNSSYLLPFLFAPRHLSSFLFLRHTYRTMCRRWSSRLRHRVSTTVRRCWRTRSSNRRSRMCRYLRRASRYRCWVRRPRSDHCRRRLRSRIPVICTDTARLCRCRCSLKGTCNQKKKKVNTES